MLNQGYLKIHALVQEDSAGEVATFYLLTIPILCVSGGFFFMEERDVFLSKIALSVDA